MFERDDVRRVLYEHSGLVVLLRNDGIAVFIFRNFGRSTIEAYIAYIRSVAAYIRPDCRNLFDLRAAGMPSQYLWELSATLYDGLEVPMTIKNAVLISSAMVHHTMMQIFLERLMLVGVNRTFVKEREALEWLNEGQDTDSPA